MGARSAKVSRDEDDGCASRADCRLRDWANCRSVQRSDFGVTVIAQGGFGDLRNDCAWSMACFRGKLSVATSRQEDSVERLTVDYYLLAAGDYSTHPLPGVNCPADATDIAMRTEIWQYTHRTLRSRRVYISPALRHPSARRRLIARDIGYRGIVVYHDAHRRPELYVGAVTPDESLLEGARTCTSGGWHLTRSRCLRSNLSMAASISVQETGITVMSAGEPTAEGPESASRWSSLTVPIAAPQCDRPACFADPHLDPDTYELEYRLQRRITYEDLAGRP